MPRPRALMDVLPVAPTERNVIIGAFLKGRSSYYPALPFTRESRFGPLAIRFVIGFIIKFMISTIPHCRNAFPTLGPAALVLGPLAFASLDVSVAKITFAVLPCLFAYGVRESFGTFETIEIGIL